MNKNRTKILTALGGCLVAVIVLFMIMGNSMQPVALLN